MTLRTLILCLVCALPVSAVGQTEASPKRIVFAQGAIVANAKGYLRGIRDEAWFVLRAGSGQHMKVEIRGRGPTRGVVVFPSGKQDGSPGGVIYDDDIDETGDYKFRVTESMMAEPWRGSFTLHVEILPRKSNQAASNLDGYAGKYPSELFHNEAPVKAKLRKLLGTSYKTFFDRMQVETPIEKDGDVLVMRGCLAHQCTIEEALLAIDLRDGALYAALKTKSKYSRTFPADRSLLPDALKRAMN